MEKILAVAIFVVMFGFVIWDRFPRQWVTLISGALVLVLVFGLCMHDGGAIWETLNLSCCPPSARAPSGTAHRSPPAASTGPPLCLLPA